VVYGCFKDTTQKEAKDTVRESLPSKLHLL